MTESREPELGGEPVAPSIGDELPAPKAEPRAPEDSPPSGLSGSPPVAGSATSAAGTSPGSAPVSSTQTNEAEWSAASLPVQSAATEPVGTVMAEPATSTDVVVVGAGIAGLAAAVAAARNGLRVMVFDERGWAGGRYAATDDGYVTERLESWPPHDPFHFRSVRDLVKELTDEAASAGVQIVLRTAVSGIFADLAVVTAPVDGSPAWVVTARRVVLATGARDRPCAFPGWTLPGILTGKAALELYRERFFTGWLGKPVAVIGSGPPACRLAHQLARSGPRLVTLVSPSSSETGFGDPLVWSPDGELHALIPSFLGPPAGEAARNRDRGPSPAPRFPEERLRLVTNARPVRAEGHDRVTALVIGTPEGERRLEVDAVCLATGYESATELAWLLGCEMRFDARSGCFVPEVDEWYRTSVAGVSAVGEIVSPSGRVSPLALRAAGERGGPNPPAPFPASEGGDVEGDPAGRGNGATGQRGDGGTWEPPFAEGSEDFLACRCEEVTAVAVRDAVRRGARSVDAVKLRTRAGMGFCQSAYCYPIVAGLIAAETGLSLAELPPYTSRFPVRPTNLTVLALAGDGVVAGGGEVQGTEPTAVSSGEETDGGGSAGEATVPNR